MSQLPGGNPWPGGESNPWLEISASDYEGHMSSPQVGQLQLLSQLFERVLAETRPESVAVLGCAAGNGFEHCNPAVTHFILGVDFNPAYLAIARQRYPAWGAQLELACADLHTDCYSGRQFDLIYAALVFEYVDAPVVLVHIRRALRPGGRLAVVLQFPVAGLPAVSPTPYKSLEKLASIMHLYQPAQFEALARQAGLERSSAETIRLPSGKEFFFGMYR